MKDREELKYLLTGKPEPDQVVYERLSDEAIDKVLAWHTAKLNEARRGARLVELDLLEQAINTEQYGLTLDATRYKLMRLRALQGDK